MPLQDLAHLIESVLRQLVGLRLSIVRNAGNMKVLHFGETRRVETGSVGQYALHIQCPWRIDHADRIVTGSEDYYIPADDNADTCWEPGTVTGHLQNQRIGELLQGYDTDTRSYVNATKELTVTTVVADSFGGFEIRLTGGYRISVFPTASRGEHWRLISPGTEAEHFVVASGTAGYE